MIVHRISCATGTHSLPTLGHSNWVAVDRVHVRFDIWHRGSSILLKYMVEEPQVRAVNTAFNSPVWEDSCVEFFLALEGDPSYYNFEFNAAGTVLGAYGPDRNTREWMDADTLSMIETTPSLGRGIIENLEPGPEDPDKGIAWELDIVLPVKALCHHRVIDIAGMKARANFYKCGDRLRKPHYLSWKKVDTETPDFHRPEFFGELTFGP
jgi:hypothetical protein